MDRCLYGSVKGDLSVVISKLSYIHVPHSVNVTEWFLTCDPSDCEVIHVAVMLCTSNRVITLFAGGFLEDESVALSLLCVFTMSGLFICSC